MGADELLKGHPQLSMRHLLLIVTDNKDGNATTPKVPAEVRKGKTKPCTTVVKFVIGLKIVLAVSYVTLLLASKL